MIYIIYKQHYHLFYKEWIIVNKWFHNGMDTVIQYHNGSWYRDSNIYHLLDSESLQNSDFRNVMDSSNITTLMDGKFIRQRFYLLIRQRFYWW